eukprot:gnl/MRDRNA2_/MRDRNA2_41772_c0_seq2.p1 gnl/MRDRNA2_/MRDRNA2_41772_c0~~gnl/MRDRNA2_/MRDRNA2_41772_c0_seq2.p1  ORF type:complete len:525 (+),score=89.48 gnl/MRDRNA2_/MRDRNA2_41772_c0_seq2:53-1627(+)
MRSKLLSSFLYVTCALTFVAAEVGEDDEELRCLDNEIGENAQSLLSSLVNVKLKQIKAGLEVHSANHTAKTTDSNTDYLIDGEQGSAMVNQMGAFASINGLHSQDASRKADTAVGAVVAAAAAEAHDIAKPDAKELEEKQLKAKELEGWQPPAARSGGEQAEEGASPSAFKGKEVHDLPPETNKESGPDAASSKQDTDNIQILDLIKRMQMSFWMDVLLFFLVFGCCCCCLREMVASWREHQEDDHVQERQIVSYDADRLVHLSILLRLFARGSLCSKVKVWQQVTFFLLLWVVLTMLLLSTIRYAAKLDDKSIRTLSSYLNSFMPFFFAMYLNVTFGRWWTMRTAGLGTMWQAVDDMCVILASHCPGEKFETQRHTLLRYGLLSQALIYQVARKQINLQELVENGILMPGEMHALQESPGSMPQTVWVWILDFWRKLHNEGHVEWWVVQHAQKLISEGRRAIKTIFTYVTCQIPFGWVHLMTFMVNITIIVLVIKAAIITAKDIADMHSAPFPCSMDIKDRIL